MRKLHCLGLALLVLAGWAATAQANVKMPAVFGGNMVLQRDAKIPLWGTADPGEKIAIAFAGQKATATAGADGKWKAELAPLKASAAGRTLTVRGNNELEFENVLVGDVWVCSGQSNMEWSAAGGLVDKEKEIEAANYPRIRLLLVQKATATTPQSDFKGKWTECAPETMRSFSAVAYFFARDLHKRLRVPIGLIGTYWGGTPAQSWTRLEALTADPELKTYLDRWAKYTEAYPAAKVKFDVQVADYKQKVADAKKAGKPAPPQFRGRLDDPEKSANRPANLYNGMIAPLVPFAIRGAIWYQGESNAGNPADAQLYTKLFGTMISDWRKQWGQGDFPFLFVQLANFMKRWDFPTESNWALLRESQLKTLALPATGMAVIIDAGEALNIHPQNKQVVGARLALAATKLAYGGDEEFSGPVFDKMDVKGGKAVLSFKHVGGGLDAKGGALKGFTVAGADKKFVWAEAKIVGKTVEVSCPEVKEPAAVRYAWADNPEATLYNKDGLPATPFRSDAWEPQPNPAPRAASPATSPARPARTAKKVNPVKK